MTSSVGVILYGPPASGKDTVTAALCRHDFRFEQYQRLKVGPGRTEGYRMGTAEELAQLAESGQILYTNRRYSAVYAIDRPEIERLLGSGRIPVVHVGQPEAINELTTALHAIRWIVVELWCPRMIAADRIEARGTGDSIERMQAWDETPRLSAPDLRIDTAETAPEAAAELIATASSKPWTVVVPTLHLVQTDGTINVPGTRRYAEIASATWVDLFLINGSTTRGDQLSLDERTALLDIWVNAVGPERVLACAWTPDDMTAAIDRGTTPMAVVQPQGAPDRLLQFFHSLPAGATIYSHPGLFGGGCQPNSLSWPPAAGACLREESSRR
ncbi:hypothetical protein [Nocardia sp. IFM 10818]